MPIWWSVLSGTFWSVGKTISNRPTATKNAWKFLVARSLSACVFGLHLSATSCATISTVVCITLPAIIVSASPPCTLPLNLDASSASFLVGTHCPYCRSIIVAPRTRCTSSPRRACPNLSTTLSCGLCRCDANSFPLRVFGFGWWHVSGGPAGLM